jgi:predicted DNA-binding transcriptional regulator AlpA
VKADLSVFPFAEDFLHVDFRPAVNGTSSSSSGEEPMTSPETQDPGHATPEELCTYWRASSVRAAEERARRLGIRKAGQGYPWLSIWRAEGLAPPPRRQWAELKLPHKTMKDIAEMLGRSDRTARRRRHHKRDAEFPDPIVFGTRTLLWRAAQIKAWETGNPVPVYKTYLKPSRARVNVVGEAIAPTPHQVPAPAIFNPFAETTQLSVGNHGFRP